jgi:hypothetical protein
MLAKSSLMLLRRVEHAEYDYAVADYLIKDFVGKAAKENAAEIAKVEPRQGRIAC